MTRSSFRMTVAASCGLAAVLSACQQGDRGLAHLVDSAVMGRAEAAKPAPGPRNKALWMEYEEGAPLPQGVVPMTSLAPLVKLLKPGVVNIYTTSVVKLRPARRLPPGVPDPFEEFWRRFGVPQESRRQSLGSGFIIHPDGYVITNNHVVQSATEIRVKLHDGRELEARTVGRDPKTDLALLKLSGSGEALHDLPTVYLGDSDSLQVGDFVVAMGNPFGLDHSVSMGIVSAKERVIGSGPYDDYIQTDAAINPGNSGGPLFNTRGEVVGVNTAIVAHGQGIGFAVPINMVKELLPQLAETGRVVRGWLGVTIQDVTPELAATLKLEKARGALVAGVMKDSPAEKADLRAGDVVVEVNGRRVDTFNQLSRYVAFISPGGKASLKVVRDGKEKRLEVVVGERPDEEDEEAEPAASPEATSADRLGLSVTQVPASRSQRLGGGGGVRIVSMQPDGAAARAGAQVGDVIVELQRQPVRTVREYTAAVSALRPGEMALMRVQRGSASIYIAVKVPK